MTKSPTPPPPQTVSGPGLCGCLIAALVIGAFVGSCAATGGSTPSLYDRYDQDDHACSRAIDALGEDDGTTELERLEACDRMFP